MIEIICDNEGILWGRTEMRFGPFKMLPSLKFELLQKDIKEGFLKDKIVLEYGCGSGFLSLQAARLGGLVLATDQNEASVRCTELNRDYNGFNQSIEVRQGSNFEPVWVDENFDVIIASLPFENAMPDDELEAAVYDANFAMRRALFDNVLLHKTSNTRIFYTYSQRVQSIVPLEASAADFDFRVISTRNICGEQYLLYLITP